MHPHISIAEQFISKGEIIEMHEFGNGNINDTYLVTSNTSDESRFVLQRINTHVFKQPKRIMQNMRTFTEHMHRRIQEEKHHWIMPRVLRANDGQDYHLDAAGNFWRAISYIPNARSFDTITNLKHAREVGYALGMFQYLISDMHVDRLADTLEGFHVTPLYLQNFDRILATNGHHSGIEVRFGLDFITKRRKWAHILEHAREKGKLPLRPVHGDPKVNNVMIEQSSGQAISLVDLDTVKPGLVHYDIGDCMRSGCNPLGEETEHWESVRFEPEIGQAILTGYLTQARHFLTEADYDYIFDSIRLLAFELGVRFFTDYLAGNVYFKVKHPEHNLQRALVQFKLAESIESHEADVRHIIQSMVAHNT